MSGAARGTASGSISGITRAAEGIFVPWPQPLALGVALGIVLSAPLAPRHAALATVGLVALSGLAFARASWRWPSSFQPGRSVTMLALLGPVALAAAIGAARMAVWQARPDPLIGHYGVEQHWRGYSDGAVLHAHWPVRARLSLVFAKTVGTAPVGRLELTGRAEPAAGTRNPGGFDHASHLRRRGVAGQLFVRNHAVSAATLPLRQRLQRGVQTGLSPPAAAIMVAMTLGIKDDLGELRDEFAAAGVAHILALSGLHVGVLLLMVARLLRPFRWRTPALMAITIGFVALVGASPSVVRAATMALALLVTSAFGTARPQPVTTLALAALVGLISAPQMLFDLSFQLSHLAVAGLLLYLPPWLARLGLALAPVGVPGEPLRQVMARLRHGAYVSMLVSFAAQLPTISLVAGTFGQVPLLAPFVNVLAVPLAGLLVPLGFTSSLLGLVALPLARVTNLLTELLARLLLSLVKVASYQPALPWGEVSWLGHACWAAFAVALAVWSLRRGALKQLLLVTLLAGGVSWAVPPPLSAPDVWYLDVGQGDSVLIRVAGAAVLIDGGGTVFSDYDVGEKVVLKALRALGVHSLAAVIATHPDTDHVEGLLSVLERLPVGLLVTGPEQPEVALDVSLRDLARRRGVPLHQARRGESLLFGRSRELRLDVIHPTASSAAESLNEASVAVVLNYRGAARAVFLGDIGLPTEPYLAVPPIDVLMVGHHGSRNSTGPGLLRAAGAEVAVISVGRNNYGHPAPEVVERLEEHSATVLTTLEHGALRFDLAQAGAVVSAPSRR